MTDVQTDIGADPPKKRGRPPNGTREASRNGTRDTVWYGRDGEVLSRRQSAFSDPYDVPLPLKDPDWDYQWNAVSVVNNTEVVIHQDSMMMANGWRPVPANRSGFKERFGMGDEKKNPTNTIIIGGLRLDERPRGMSDAAREQEYQAATGQIRDRDAALKGGKAALAQTLERQGLGTAEGYKGRKSNVRLDIDPEAPRPGYQYGTDE